MASFSLASSSPQQNLQSSKGFHSLSASKNSFFPSGRASYSSFALERRRSTSSFGRGSCRIPVSMARR